MKYASPTSRVWVLNTGGSSTVYRPKTAKQIESIWLATDHQHASSNGLVQKKDKRHMKELIHSKFSSHHLCETFSVKPPDRGRTCPILKEEGINFTGKMCCRYLLKYLHHRSIASQRNAT